MIKDFRPILSSIAAAHNDVIRTYTLTSSTAELHCQLKTDHVDEVNFAIEKGEMPPKTKATDLTTISEESFKKAMEYVQHLHAQKEMFSEFVNIITEPIKEKPRMQPIAADIKAAVLCFPGPLVTYQAFKKFSPSSIRRVPKQEYEQLTHSINAFGHVADIQVPRCTQKPEGIHQETTHKNFKLAS